MAVNRSGLGSAYPGDRPLEWDYGAVSDGGADDGPLHRDDGSVHDNRGAVPADHTTAKAWQSYRKGSGFSQPSDKDFGSADFATVDHIDGSDNKPEWNPCSEAKQSQGWTDQPLNASPARVKKVSSDETDVSDPERWYGWPGEKRRGG
jgi:hypothetical protein